MKVVWPYDPARFFSNALVIIVLLTLLLGNVAGAAPQIAIDKPYWDFGIMTNQMSLTHDFSISNSGDGPLIISRVVSTCEVCLHANAEKTNLPPHTATVIHALLDLRLLNGSVSRGIMIGCNDTNDPTPVLELTGIVVPLFRVFPPDPVLDLSVMGAAATVEIVPLSRLHAPLSQVDCGNTNLQGTLSPKDDGGYLLTLQAAKTLPQGEESVRIIIRTSDTNDPVCSFHLFIRNPHPMEIIPAELIFQPQADEQTRILWLKQHGIVPLTLLDVVPPSDQFHCEINPDANGRDYTIYVTAWQQESMSGRTNVLVVKWLDASNVEKDINVPVFVQKP